MGNLLPPDVTSYHRRKVTKAWGYSNAAAAGFDDDDDDWQNVSILCFEILFRSSLWVNCISYAIEGVVKMLGMHLRSSLSKKRYVKYGYLQKHCNKGVTEVSKVIAICYILKCMSLARRQKCPFQLFARKLYCDNRYYRDLHQSSWMQKTPDERCSGIARQFGRLRKTR
jgi:hypothetical protein